MNNFLLLGCLRLALFIASDVLVFLSAFKLSLGQGTGSGLSFLQERASVIVFVMFPASEINVTRDSDWQGQNLILLELCESQGRRDHPAFKYIESIIK